MYDRISALWHIKGIQLPKYTFVQVQLCSVSANDPLVIPIHNGTLCYMVNFSRNGCMCVLKDIVDAKQFLDKNLTGFIRCSIRASYYTSFAKFC